jgi:hypothetical protein
MGMRPEQTEAEVGRRLAAAHRPGSKNEITAVELCQWAVDYLAEYDTELRRFPELAGQPHWNLWMNDAQFQDALFAVLVFRPGRLEFLCGTGDAYAIRRFAENDRPDEVERLPAEMARLFAVPESSLHLGREEAEAWLGRGW